MIFFWMCAGLGLLAICIAATIAIIKLTPRMRLPRPPRPRREPPRHEWSYSSMEMKTTVRSSGDQKISIKNGVVRYKDGQGRCFWRSSCLSSSPWPRFLSTCFGAPRSTKGKNSYE